MTIDDELLIELFKPERNGKAGKGALIASLAGTLNIEYKLEEPKQYETKTDPFQRTWSMMTPDIIITIPTEKKEIAVEFENDVHWDFQQSLRQVKKYRSEFPDTRVIIPKKFERFAPLYRNEGFRVYLWKAKRRWQCLRCGTINVNESHIPRKCEGKDSEGKNCLNKRRDEFDLVGLEDTKIWEYAV